MCVCEREREGGRERRVCVCEYIYISVCERVCVCERLFVCVCGREWVTFVCVRKSMFV